MPENLSHQLLREHLVDAGAFPEPGEEIALRMDQTLTQDATGTLVMLELEAMGIDRVRTERSVQYVDHNLLQEDYRNPDDHLFLLSACRKFGVHFSPAGNGVSHPVHMERFGIPGKTLVGSDSHTPAAGALGMLAFGAGGVEVAVAMAGEPLHLPMPEIWGIELTGSLAKWVSAKDVILELLRRHDVDGGRGRILEYHGPGLASLSAMDRHVIANMGTELGATSSVFPADDRAREFLSEQGRGSDFVRREAEPNAAYDIEEQIDLSALEPLIACPSSPGNVVPVSEVAGREIYQAYIGSSANPGLRDFVVPALMVDGRLIAEGVSFDVNPTSRQVLLNLADLGYLGKLIGAGARIHQAGCNGCIGMGQAPATGRISLRTVPRNFPGRSGTVEDQVYLCSPETATASALAGVITDPRDLDQEYPVYKAPGQLERVTDGMVAPAGVGEARGMSLEKGPNIESLPELEPVADAFSGPVLLKLGDGISTDEIMPAGARILPYRSNIPRMSEFVFTDVDDTFVDRSRGFRETGFAVVAGENYGQGSSREHAALAPRHLGLRVVIAKSFARIHHQNLVNFGILPFIFADPDDWEALDQDEMVALPEDLMARLSSQPHSPIPAKVGEEGRTIGLRHRLGARQIGILRAGSILAHAGPGSDGGDTSSGGSEVGSPSPGKAEEKS